MIAWTESPTVSWMRDVYSKFLEHIGLGDIEPPVSQPIDDLMANYRQHIKV
jgi:hypothetical protein